MSMDRCHIVPVALLKRLSFLHEIAFASLPKIRLVFLYRSISDSLVYSIDTCIYRHHTVFMNSCTLSLIRLTDSSHFLKKTKTNCFNYSSLLFHIHFRIILSISTKKNLAGIFTGIELTSISIWRELTSLLRRVYYSMDTVCL